MFRMPVSRFWTYNRNIDRITAEQNTVQLSILNASQSKEGYKEIARSLERIKGDVVVMEKRIDTPEEAAAKIRKLIMS